MRSALVLGGAGFFGRWLVRALLETGVRVVSVDRDPRGRLSALTVDSVQGDIALSDRVLIDLLIDGRFDVVIQAVGTGSVPRSLEHPLGDLVSNAHTTVTVLDVLARLAEPPLLVHVSSAAVYGDSVHLPMDEDHPLAPVSPYGISKLAAEHYVRLYARLSGNPCLSLRPFSLYGPGQRKLFVYDLLLRLEAGEDPLLIKGSPDVTRDFVFVRDAAQNAVVLARQAPAAGEAYNLSAGRGTSLGELAHTLAEVSGRSPEIGFTGEVRPGDPLRWEGATRRGVALGADRHTPLADGLRETVAWLRDSASISGQP